MRFLIDLKQDLKYCVSSSIHPQLTRVTAVSHLLHLYVAVLSLYTFFSESASKIAIFTDPSSRGQMQMHSDICLPYIVVQSTVRIFLPLRGIMHAIPCQLAFTFCWLLFAWPNSEWPTDFIAVTIWHPSFWGETRGRCCVD